MQSLSASQRLHAGASTSAVAPRPAVRLAPLRRTIALRSQASGDTAFALTGSENKSAEQMMEEVLDRIRKTTAEECPFCADAPVKENGKKCVGVCRNPQNVPGPLVFPHEMQTAEDAVRLQLNAMRDIHQPRFNHGIQVLYEFSVDAGTMDRSRYFGFSSDLYHFDHFMGKALAAFNDLVDNHSYDIMPAETMPCGRTRVRAVVENNVGQTSEWTFIMVMRTFGKYKGCWNTHRLLRSDSEWIGEPGV